MTLREMFPEWWCKITFSLTENCSGNYNWLDFSIYEFIFTVVIVLVIKWIIYCSLFISRSNYPRQNSGCNNNIS